MKRKKKDLAKRNLLDDATASELGCGDNARVEDLRATLNIIANSVRDLDEGVFLGRGGHSREGASRGRLWRAVDVSQLLCQRLAHCRPID